MSDSVGKAFRGDAAVSKTAEPGSSPGTDVRQAATLRDAALNPDGKTWNGAKALAWLSEAMNPGKGIPEEEVARMFEEAKAKRSQ